MEHISVNIKVVKHLVANTEMELKAPFTFSFNDHMKMNWKHIFSYFEFKSKKNYKIVENV